MFGSSLKRSLIAISAALAMSGLFVSAAVGPAQAQVSNVAGSARA